MQTVQRLHSLSFITACIQRIGKVINIFVLSVHQGGEGVPRSLVTGPFLRFWFQVLSQVEVGRMYPVSGPRPLPQTLVRGPFQWRGRGTPYQDRSVPPPGWTTIGYFSTPPHWTRTGTLFPLSGPGQGVCLSHSHAGGLSCLGNVYMFCYWLLLQDWKEWLNFDDSPLI